MDESNAVGIVGLILQYLVVPVLGAGVWLISKVMRIDSRVTVLEAVREDTKEQHKEVMKALSDHNDGVSNRLQSIEEHLRDRHNTG